VMGLAGRRILDWLISILDALEFASPPKGADFHLVLDLYQREANRVSRTIMIDDPPASALLSKLAPLAKEEVECTRRILSTINGSRQVDEFNDALRQFPDDELGKHFATVRGMIARTLLRASPNGYGFTSSALGSEQPNDLVRQMVLRGSEALHVIM